MSIGSISSSALSPLFAPRCRSSDQPSSTEACGGGMCSTPTVPDFDELSGVGGQTAEESHLALQIRSRTELITGSDGTVRERSTAKLRFHYDLTTADGQHVELNVKAKVRQVSFQDAAGNSISRTQVKLQFSLLQEGVAEELSPLQSNPFPGDVQSGVSDGLAAFLNAVGDALQQFVDGDNASADDLVEKTVDTFNTLVDALANLLSPQTPSDAPPALPPDGSPSQIPAIAQPSDSITSPALPSLENPLLLPPPLPAAGSTIDEPTSAETLPVVSEGSAATDVPVAIAESIPAEPDALVTPSVPAEDSREAASPAQAANQVLQNVRLRFTQSLIQIIRTLTPDGQPGSSSGQSQSLYYQSSLSLRVHTASLVDASA